MPPLLATREPETVTDARAPETPHPLLSLTSELLTVIDPKNPPTYLHLKKREGEANGPTLCALPLSFTRRYVRAMFVVPPAVIVNCICGVPSLNENQYVPGSSSMSCVNVFQPFA